MIQKNTVMLGMLNEKLGTTLQLVNVNKECAEMQMMISELLRGGQVDRQLFTEGVTDLYVMMNALIQLYGISAEEIEQIAETKLMDSLQALGLAGDDIVNGPAVAEVPPAAPAPVVPEPEAAPVTEEKNIEVATEPVDDVTPPVPQNSSAGE